MLSARKTPPKLIEITKATACKILVHKVGQKIQAHYMAAFNAIKNKDSGSTKKTMFVSNFILNALVPCR